jgi:hypothetical protein
MDLPLTLTLAAISLSIAVVCGWLGARAPNPKKGPRMMPYRAIMLLSGALFLILLPHIASLLGVELPGQR